MFLVELHPYVYKASRELIEYCKSNGVTIESYSGLGPIIYKPDGPVNEVVEELATKYNRSPAQILLKWNLIKGLFSSLLKKFFNACMTYR